ncbi:MAG TPA: hypothetical protein P5191_08045 [Ruminococcus sp.]|nr:hypothetical protein [Ruminococcus sp.]
MKHPSDPNGKKENKTAVYILIALISPVYVLYNIIECAELIRKYCPGLPGILMDIFSGKYALSSVPYMHISIVSPIMVILCVVGVLAGNSSSNK